MTATVAVVRFSLTICTPVFCSEVGKGIYAFSLNEEGDLLPIGEPIDVTLSAAPPICLLSHSVTPVIDCLLL